MKAQGILDFILGGVVISLVIILITLSTAKYTIQENIDIQYRFDSAQSTLLALMSTTNSTGYPLIEKIGEKIVLPAADQIDLSQVTDALNKLVFADQCYTLSTMTEVILQKGNCNQYSAFTKIPLPYNPDSSKLDSSLTLEVNS